MTDKIDNSLIEECEMHIVGHKIFVRLKDIPMYLSKKTKDSIRNRYSHSVEVGLSTEYLLSHVSRELGNDINLNFFKIAKIIGLVHDIGHTAFSHDGEIILDTMLREASASFSVPIRFNANLNNFRRISKYGLFDLLPEDIKKYALASLIKRKQELRQYPEYLYLKDDLTYAIELEEKYLASKGIEIHNTTNKTILCQAMDLADENRYRVTDIIDALNIYSKPKLKEILLRCIRSEVRIKDIRKLVSLKVGSVESLTHSHSDKMRIKDLLIMLLNQESNAKTEFQNVMNSISMAFNRNFYLNQNAKLVPLDKEIEKLREDFHKVAATYLWGAKKIKNIKKPFNHYFTTVADYFINHDFNIDIIDSSTYKSKLIALEKKILNDEVRSRAKLLLIRNFLGGLTNLKIIELYKKIKLAAFENTLGYKIDKREKFLIKDSIQEFEKKLDNYNRRLIDKVSA
ncbi:HD domain-containing protein [Sulfurovum sp.]|uniref:HD domain-containing protein n=1 Tax=Sulfurovum sp. TaxID=1969726 RepID=UPI0028680EEA|nr:HD domain-containing protein [Sulfurovum sp.]